MINHSSLSIIKQTQLNYSVFTVTKMNQGRHVACLESRVCAHIYLRWKQWIDGNVGSHHSKNSHLLLQHKWHPAGNFVITSICLSLFWWAWHTQTRTQSHHEPQPVAHSIYQRSGVSTILPEGSVIPLWYVHKQHTKTKLAHLDRFYWKTRFSYYVYIFGSTLLYGRCQGIALQLSGWFITCCFVADTVGG